MAAPDHYLRERRHDLEFVEERLLHALSGVEGLHLKLDEPAIVVAHHLSPADTAALANQPVEGFATKVGSRTCHTAIMARALGIPAVVGLGERLREVGSGDLLILDGLRGRVMIMVPLVATVAEVRRARQLFDQAREQVRRQAWRWPSTSPSAS